AQRDLFPPVPKSPSARAPAFRTRKSVCVRRQLRELLRCTLPAFSRPSNFDPRAQLVAAVQRFPLPVADARGGQGRVVLPGLEFQRRADRTLFRSRRASVGCSVFRSVVVLCWYLHSAKRLIALTPLSLFTYSLKDWVCLRWLS